MGRAVSRGVGARGRGRRPNFAHVRDAYAEGEDRSPGRARAGRRLRARGYRPRIARPSVTCAALWSATRSCAPARGTSRSSGRSCASRATRASGSARLRDARARLACGATALADRSAPRRHATLNRRSRIPTRRSSTWPRTMSECSASAPSPASGRDRALCRDDRRRPALLPRPPGRGYLGLVPRELSSGDSQRRGSITKAGPPRWLLIQAASPSCAADRRAPKRSAPGPPYCGAPLVNRLPRRRPSPGRGR